MDEEAGWHRCTGTGSGIHSAASLTKTIQIRLSAVFIMVGALPIIEHPRISKLQKFITEIFCTDLQYENMRKTGRAATRSCDVGDNLSSAADDMSRHLDLQSAVHI